MFDAGRGVIIAHGGLRALLFFTPVQFMPLHQLNDFALLRFTGSDARDFLHGQLTCDVQALQPGFSSYGGYCSPKGRLLATFLLVCDGEGYTMLLPAAIAEAIRKRLAMYVLRSKVAVSLMSVTPIGASGDDLAAALFGLRLEVPAQTHRASGCAIRLPGDRVLVIGEQNQPVPADDGHWRRLDIAAGIPFIGPETQEQFVPQMVNLDLIGALSYSKGCYPGQEIVARTHYLGRLKQRMYRVSAQAVLSAGDKLYCAELGDQSAGMIVSAVQDGSACTALAVLQTANATTAIYHAGSLQGPALKLETLPYTIH